MIRIQQLFTMVCYLPQQIMATRRRSQLFQMQVDIEVALHMLSNPNLQNIVYNDNNDNARWEKQKDMEYKKLRAQIKKQLQQREQNKKPQQQQQQ